MKNCVLILTISIFLVGCHSSFYREYKALKLIDAAMSENLHEYADYERTETVLNNGFTSIYTDSLIRSYAVKAETADILYTKALEKAVNLMSLNLSDSDDYRARLKEIHDECDILERKMEGYIVCRDNAEDSIRILAAQFKPVAIGWEVSHRFTFKTEDGHSTYCHYVYIMDEEFSTIIAQYDLNSEQEKDIRFMIKYALKDK